MPQGLRLKAEGLNGWGLRLVAYLGLRSGVRWSMVRQRCMLAVAVVATSTTGVIARRWMGVLARHTRPPTNQMGFADAASTK
eukprot:4940069-Pyramimonas_sp.AAC.2